MEPTSKQIWLHQTKKNIYNVLLFTVRPKWPPLIRQKTQGDTAFYPASCMTTKHLAL